MQTRLAATLRPEVLTAYHEKTFQAPVIGVTGGKGGVGKTTVAVNIAYALADMGHKVALVDADVDAPNAAILLGMALENSADVCTTVPLFDENKCKVITLPTHSFISCLRALALLSILCANNIQ